MTPSRANVETEEKRDTIPAPPPSAATLVQDADDAPVESRVESRRRDTIPAPATVPTLDLEDEPTTDRTPTQRADAV